MGMSQFVLRVGCEYEDRGKMPLWCCLEFQQKRHIVYVKSPDAVSHNVISFMLQIKVSDLAAKHQRLDTSRAHAKQTSKTEWQAHIYSQELIESIWQYSTLCRTNALVWSHHKMLAYLSLHFSPQINKMSINHWIKALCTFRKLFNTHNRNSQTFC